MTVEDCRVILKVHICAAESVGKMREAMAMLEVLGAVDSQRLQEYRENPVRVDFQAHRKGGAPRAPFQRATARL